MTDQTATFRLLPGILDKVAATEAGLKPGTSTSEKKKKGPSTTVGMTGLARLATP
jgi:hypothetical protein